MSSSSIDLEQLSQAAWEALEQSDAATAKELGAQLVEAGTEFGYRVLALASAMEDDRQGAIDTIRAGIEIFPDVWQLHMQLGNFYSDAEMLNEALESFDTALQCSDVEQHWVQMNQAVVFVRLGDFDQALNLLQQIDHSDARNEAFELKINILGELGRNDLILELAEEELEDLNTPENDPEANLMSRICIQIAKAGWYEDESDELVMHYLKQAISFYRLNEEALWLLREMDAQFSDESKIFSLMVQGSFVKEASSSQNPAKFFTSYVVVADNPAEALAYIRDFEIEEIDKNSLSIQEVEEMPNEEDDPKGIYKVMGFAFFEE